MKHFETLGVEVHYKAPVKEYHYFQREADKTINALIEKHKKWKI
jgi:type III restriction enzyme